LKTSEKVGLETTRVQACNHNGRKGPIHGKRIVKAVNPTFDDGDSETGIAAGFVSGLFGIGRI